MGQVGLLVPGSVSGSKRLDSMSGQEMATEALIGNQWSVARVTTERVGTGRVNDDKYVGGDNDTRPKSSSKRTLQMTAEIRVGPGDRQHPRAGQWSGSIEAAIVMLSELTEAATATVACKNSAQKPMNSDDDEAVGSQSAPWRVPTGSAGNSGSRRC